MFSDLISYTGNKYINVNDKTINLNKDFKNILKVVKNHKKNISLFENESFVMLLKEKKCKLLCEDLRSYYDYFFLL